MSEPLAPAQLATALAGVEAAGPEERLILLCFIAGAALDPDEDELHAALRRSELLLAAGGDPRRPLDPGGRAVTALAEDLDDPALREALADALAALRLAADGLPGTTAALVKLCDDRDLAWRNYAAALLADALAGGR